VTPIKDQGLCISDWAISAVESLEGQHFRATGKLVPLSAQNIIDCSRSFGTRGCDGGIYFQAFAYIEQNNGVDTEESYPYKAKVKF
jgi:cathepsin L